MPPPRLSATTTTRAGSVPPGPGPTHHGGRPDPRPGPRWGRQRQGPPRGRWRRPRRYRWPPGWPPPRRSGSRGGEGFDVTDGHRGRDHQGALGRHPGKEPVGQSGLGQPGVGSVRSAHRPDDLLGPGFGRTPGRRPLGNRSWFMTGRSAPSQLTGELPAEEAGVGRDHVGSGVVGVAPSPPTDRRRCRWHPAGRRWTGRSRPPRTPSARPGGERPRAGGPGRNRRRARCRRRRLPLPAPEGVHPSAARPEPASPAPTPGPPRRPDRHNRHRR